MFYYLPFIALIYIHKYAHYVTATGCSVEIALNIDVCETSDVIGLHQYQCASFECWNSFFLPHRSEKISRSIDMTFLINAEIISMWEWEERSRRSTCRSGWPVQNRRDQLKFLESKWFLWDYEDKLVKVDGPISYPFISILNSMSLIISIRSIAVVDSKAAIKL